MHTWNLLRRVASRVHRSIMVWHAKAVESVAYWLWLAAVSGDFAFIQAHLHLFVLIYKPRHRMHWHWFSTWSGSKFDRKTFGFLVASWPVFYMFICASLLYCDIKQLALCFTWWNEEIQSTLDCHRLYSKKNYVFSSRNHIINNYPNLRIAIRCIAVVGIHFHGKFTVEGRMLIKKRN